VKFLDYAFVVSPFSLIPPRREATPAELYWIKTEMAAIESAVRRGIKPDLLRARLDQLRRMSSLGLVIFPAGQQIYRGRVLSKKPVHLREMMYPPQTPDFPPQGRVNRRGQSVFYGSLNEAACYFECGAKVGDYFCIAEFGTSQEMAVIAQGFVNPEAAQIRMTHGGLALAVKPMGNTAQDRLLEAWHSDVFTRTAPPGGEKSLYDLSNALASYAFEEGASLDGHTFSGVVYPSVATHLLMDNVAIKPAYADSLQLVRCWLLRIESMAIEPGMSPGTPVGQTRIVDWCFRCDKQGFFQWKVGMQFTFPKWHHSWR